MKPPRRLVDDSELFAELVDDAKRREPSPEALKGLLDKLSAPRAAEAPISASRSWGRVALVGAGCIALFGAVALGRWQMGSGPRSTPAAPTIAPVPSSPVVPGTSAASAAPAMDSAPAVSIDDLPSTKDVPPPPAGRTATAPPSFPAPAKPSMRREIELIAQAREALTRGDGRACLAAVDLHDREFPSGQFGLEAKVMRVEATLAAGDREGARALARDYLAKNPGSPYEVRVRSLLAKAEDR